MHALSPQQPARALQIRTILAALFVRGADQHSDATTKLQLLARATGALLATRAHAAELDALQGDATASGVRAEVTEQLRSSLLAWLKALQGRKQENTLGPAVKAMYHVALTEQGASLASLLDRLHGVVDSCPALKTAVTKARP